MTNQELRARTAILPEFASMAMNAGEQLQDAQLSKGFVPNELQPLVDEAITGAAPTFSDRPLTDLELSTLDTWFVAHPEKIAGTQIAGSGFIAPVRTRGNMEDLERVFTFLDEAVVQSSEFKVQSEPVLNSQTANEQQPTTIDKAKIKAKAKAKASAVALRLKRKNETG